MAAAATLLEFAGGPFITSLHRRDQCPPLEHHGQDCRKSQETIPIEVVHKAVADGQEQANLLIAIRSTLLRTSSQFTICFHVISVLSVAGSFWC